MATASDRVDLALVEDGAPVAGNISRNFARNVGCPRRLKKRELKNKRENERKRERSIRDASYALVYTSVMMVYGRWRRRPRGGRVGHAVNRRTQPRQNLRRNTADGNRRWLARRCALSLITSFPAFRPGRSTTTAGTSSLVSS